MPLDVLGIAMLYPTKAGSTNSWFISDGFEDSPRIRLNESVSGNNTSGYQLDDNGQVRLSISADSQDVDIGCDNNFEQSWNRGYVHKSNDWTNVEQTGFFWISEAGPEDNEIILKGPTGEHHSNTDCCSGSTYNHKVGLENPVNFELTKEMWHVNYDGIVPPTPATGENYSVLGHGWFGVKAITYIKGSGANKTVKLEMWYNADGLGQTWKKVKEAEDTGGWGEGGDECGGEPDQILAFGNARMMFRWDYDEGDSDIKFRNLSVREIDPFGQFENPTDPENPGTNQDIITFQSVLKLQRHINYNEASCGPGGGTLAFYDNIALTPSGGLSITKYYFDTIGIGEYAVNASSEMVGRTLHTFEIPMKKFGSPPATPTVKAKIFDSGHNLIFTSPTTFDPSAFTTSYVTKTFDFSGNTRIFVAGDTVEVEVDEVTTFDNNVVVPYTTTLKTNSHLYYWEDGDRYNDTGKELICKMIQ